MVPFIRKRAEEIVKGLTLRERIGQLNQTYIPDRSPELIERIKKQIRAGELSSIIFVNSATAGNDSQESTKLEFVNELQKVAMEESRAKIPLIIGRDVIHGHETVFPIPLALSATFNPELIESAYRMIAAEAANSGIHWAFSPMIDVARDPRWGRCAEGVGEDPYLAECVAEAVVRGFQGDDPSARDSLVACPKHYIGYAGVDGGRDYVMNEISDYTLRNYYLKPFRAALRAGAVTVMNSFNTLNGLPTTANRYLLHDVLKDELGLDGFVVTDWGNVGGLYHKHIATSPKEAVAMAMNAGADMDMCTNLYMDHLEALVNEGAVSEETVNEAAKRIVYVKLLYGLFEHPYGENVPYDRDAHEAAAKRAADESTVLLKNKNKILPLSDTAHVYFAGPLLYALKNQFGTWTLDGDATRLRTIADEAKARSKTAVVPAANDLWDDNMAKYRDADAIVLILGESRSLTGENNSIADVDFPRDQLELVKRFQAFHKPLVGVFCFGRPIAITEEVESYFDAILYPWHGGTRSAASIVSILYGDSEPSGRLPMTLPRTTGQIPMYYNYYPVRGGAPYYLEECRSAYLDYGQVPAYHFGFGLSYADFVYGRAEISATRIPLADLEAGKTVKVSVDVTNTSDRDGIETVQCYVRDDFTPFAARPFRELKAFKKVNVPAGKTVRVELPLSFESFAYYHPDKSFGIDKGDFNIYVGRDCYALAALHLTVD